MEAKDIASIVSLVTPLAIAAGASAAATVRWWVERRDKRKPPTPQVVQGQPVGPTKPEEDDDSALVRELKSQRRVLIKERDKAEAEARYYRDLAIRHGWVVADVDDHRPADPTP